MHCVVLSFALASSLLTGCSLANSVAIVSKLEVILYRRGRCFYYKTSRFYLLTLLYLYIHKSFELFRKLVNRSFHLSILSYLCESLGFTHCLSSVSGCLKPSTLFCISTSSVHLFRQSIVFPTWVSSEAAHGCAVILMTCRIGCQQNLLSLLLVLSHLIIPIHMPTLTLLFQFSMLLCLF